MSLYLHIVDKYILRIMNCLLGYYVNTFPLLVFLSYIKLRGMV